MIKMSITDQLMEISKKKVDGNSLIDNDGGDSKVKTLYSHFITLSDPTISIFFNYISDNAENYTINTLKTALNGKSVICSGFSSENGLAQYIYGEARGLTVATIDLSDGSTAGFSIDNTFSISDSVAEI